MKVTLNRILIVVLSIEFGWSFYSLVGVSTNHTYTPWDCIETGLFLFCIFILGYFEGQYITWEKVLTKNKK